MTYDATALRNAYSSVADVYIKTFGSNELALVDDRQVIDRWADSLDGPILDAGCGPGHWTEFLHSRGHEVVGIDMVPSFLDSARRRFPQCRYEEAYLQHLPAADESIDGILAWYSIIHTDPRHVGEIFREFSRVLRPGGSLLLGFFAGTSREAFDHKVATAWYWTIDDLTRELHSHGLLPVESAVATRPPARTHGQLWCSKLVH